jgi:two-component system sensor kinase FixL
MTGRGAFPSEQVERLGFVASQFMAIVDRKVEEEELAMYRQHLQDAVEARSAELRAAERLVVRAEKLATLGRVAGSVAHELRNPLGAIRNASYYLQKTASDRLDGKHLRHLQIIDEYVGRANNAITAILDFTQGRPTQRVRCALRPIVERAVADAALPQTVDVRLAIDDGLPAVLADDQQMAVVFRNLLINASQAMSGHGRVRVSASAARGRVVVGVADQGVGISREHMARLFEPLFTTKEIGVGLGLAICRAFIEANGGSIKIDSEVGKGTTVRVSLPAAQPEPAAKS